MPRPGRHVPDAYARAPPQDERCSGRWRSPPRRGEGLTIRVGACWALEDGAPGHPASVAPPILRLGHLAAPEIWGSRETPAHTHRAGLDGRLLSSGAVWWRGDVDEDRRCVWLSASAPSAKSGPCGGRSRATIGAISASGAITKPGLRTSKPSAQHGVRPGTRASPPRSTCGAERMGTRRSPRDGGGAGSVKVRRRTCWCCDRDEGCARPVSPAGEQSLAVCQRSIPCHGEHAPPRRARRGACTAARARQGSRPPPLAGVRPTRCGRARGMV
jgi:hypothetical protein